MISIKLFKPLFGSIKQRLAAKQHNAFSKVITTADTRLERASERTIEGEWILEDFSFHGLDRIHLVHLASSKLISRLTSIADIQRYLSLLFDSQIQSLAQVCLRSSYSDKRAG